jgi:DNA-binding response OmpR family regulator
MQSPADIIIAEDERIVRLALTDLFTKANYDVRSARDAEMALELYRQKKPDLLILDVMMPKKDGFSLCEKIRRIDHDTPIVFLTQLVGEENELKGLESGADCYIPKTVSNEILLARVKALLRKKTMSSPDKFKFGSWEINKDSKTMTSQTQDRAVILSQREANLLEFFSENPGKVFSRDFLFSKFWSDDYDGSDNSLTMAIMRLREKLGADGAKITTVRACGYTYEPEKPM